MKITQINAYPNCDTAGTTTSIDITLHTDLPVTEALASVLALFAGQTSYNEDNAARQAMQAARYEQGHLGGTGAADTKAAEASVIDEPAAKVTRTRRPRTNPDAAPATETVVVDQARAIDAVIKEDAEVLRALTDAPVEGRRRTRVTAEAAAPEVKVITDADLAKACSNAAAIVGIEVVQAVIKDFAVSSMQELAADVREKFLGELEDEIRLAKEELAGAGK